ncbi:MAG: hypothetical protein H0V51_12475 [Chloroflexi bacterium]|nr:hypothetical protein [Chloroflexota bacterium]
MLSRPGPGIRLEDVLGGADFLWSLPGFLRRPIDPEEARAILRRRLERRELDFLGVVKWAIYEHAGSPYRELLGLAGCEYGDLERLVREQGLEGALHSLYRHGVYLTVDEFKGRRPVIRGSATLSVDPDRLRNPRSAVHVPAQSGGSRGIGTRVPVDLAFIRDRAVTTYLALAARGGTAWRHALWEVPGGAATSRLLLYSLLTTAPIRWFSLVDPGASGLHPRYRWSGRILRWGSLLAGVSLPSPRYVPLERPLPIARWMAATLRAGRTPHLSVSVSSAVRLCRAALDAGIDIRGAQLWVGAEAATAARLAAIRRSGVEAVPSYASAEGGAIAYGCLAPEAPDDLHLFHDLLALVQPGPEAADQRLPPYALLMSSLLATAPLILLNVSMGDQAVIERRVCGCPLERLGWATHLHTVRSFEKLTAGGMTFLDADVIRVLEEVLPARFGGGPTDYQLLEEEEDDGRPRLRLLVHPSVGPLDGDAVADAFLRAIGHGSGADRVMGLLWREAGFVRVERRAPRTTPSGKILHLHVDRGARAEG